MGYSHSFFALDISELKNVFGSKNESLLKEILDSAQEDIVDNDAFFEDEIENGDLPGTAAVIREIFEGQISKKDGGAMYGYALQMICSHMGEYVEGGEYGVADVTDHPYNSALVTSGLPIPIPEPEDFPMIGYLDVSQLDEELGLATADHQDIASDSAKTKSMFRNIMSAVGLGLRSGRIDPEEMQEDIDAYVEILEAAKKLGKGLVSFRH